MRSLFVVAGLVLFVATASHAQETSGFVVRLGNDTLSLENVTRTATQIRGEYVIRSPRTSYRTYTAELSRDGTIRRFELLIRNLDGESGTAETRSTIEFMGDSAITTAPRGDSTVTTHVVVGKGAIPALQAVMGLLEQLGRQAIASKRASYTAALLSPGASQANKALVSRARRDTLSLTIDTQVGKVGPWKLRFDKSGRLLSYSGKGTPFQAEAQRVDSVDLASAMAAYGNRPLGQLSVRDTARLSLGSDELWVDYGRPMKRGREIFGNVVPWGVVWRTGANTATHFHTPIDLVIGGAAVPAGTYTLWTLPTPSGWKLIINQETGQWGTVYHEARDLVRVDMNVETLSEPIEKFTIDLEPQGEEALLKASWDRTRVTVPVARKK